jgi:PPM family protein phosphatase
MQFEQKVEYAALTDIGSRRRNNQDSYALRIAGSREQWLERGHLFLVADGMGGHAVGELASKIAADTIPHTYHKLQDQPAAEALVAAVHAGNATIHARGEMNRDFTRMGTTCTTLVLCSEGVLIAHVGDSRAYRIRADRIEQLTFDHSLQWELLRQGKMSPAEIFRNEPRNIITRSLGPSASVQVDLEGSYPVRPNDIFLLCSDGLSGLVKDEEIGAVTRELPPADACRLLVNLANLRGGPDNITVVIVRVGAIPAELPQEAEPGNVDRDSGFVGWIWLFGMLTFGLAFIGGHALTLLDRPITGLLVEAAGALGIGLLILGSLRARRLATERGVIPAMTPGTPYRTASARTTPAFVTELASLENNLQLSALEEGWSIDWTKHKGVFESGKIALAEGRYSQALADYAKAIQILMAGIQSPRKPRDPASRKGPSPADGSEEVDPERS